LVTSHSENTPESLMEIFRKRGIAVAAATLMVVFGVSGSSWARTVRTRVHAGLRSPMRMKAKPVAMTGETVVPGMMPNVTPDAETLTAMPVDQKPYKLRMSNLHTGETLDIVYRVGNTYICAKRFPHCGDFCMGGRYSW